MQATLLSIAGAIILALVVALVGPHFVDWTSYRAAIEGEATRLTGTPVRIGGGIEVRILPTPTLTLQRLEIGGAAQHLARARELHAELALGSLMRGEFRASDVRVSGLDVALKVDGSGKLDWPMSKLGFDPDRLMAERLAIEDSALTLIDAASEAKTQIEGFWFKGDVRTLLGPLKGEGGFRANGERFGYRVAAGRVVDGETKIKLGLDPADQPLSIEVDGGVRIEDSSPRFDGTLMLSRPVAVAGASGRGTVATPWRASAKVKASPANALFEQLEYQYGPEARAIRLTGTAEMRFGKEPRFEGVISARQADLDRALALPEASSRLPLTTLKAFIESLASSYRPSFPARLGIGVDAVTLASGTLQNLRGDLKLDADGWDIEQLEFRAPGFAQVRLSGRVGGGQAVSFRGPAQIEASDPKAFVAWLEGRSDANARQTGQLRASGDVTVGAQEFAVERLRFEFDRKSVEGRFAYSGTDGLKAPRLDAELKAGELDVDGVLAFARAALEGSAIERPRDIALTVDIARATLGGVDIKGVSGTFKLDPAGLTFDRVRVTNLGDASFNVNGRMEGALDAPRGTVTFDVDARSLDGTLAMLSRYFPKIMEPLRVAAPRIVPLKAQATLGVEPAISTNPSGASKVKLALEGTAGTLRTKMTAEAAGDLATIALSEFRLDGQASATDGSALIALLGLDRMLNVDKRAGTLLVAVRSATGSDARVDAKLTAGGLTASANGTARLFSVGGPASTLDVAVQAADMSPLRRGAAAQSTTLLPVALRAKLSANADDVAFDGITGNVAGAPVRGKLKLTFDTQRKIEGQIDADAIEVMPLLASLAGIPKIARGDTALWAGDPFGEATLAGYEGQLALSAGRATIMPSLVGRQMKATLRLGAGEAVLENVEGTVAGGRASGRFSLRPDANGLTANLRFALANADAATLLSSDGKPVVNGRVALSAEVEGSGLSAASLAGSLTGSGMITLEDAQISGLDPRAFNAAIRAADQGLVVDSARIRDVVSTVLDGGYLAIPRLDAPVVVTAGQARVSRTMVYGQGADLVLSGDADLGEGSIDARLSLSGPTINEGTTKVRPEILVALKGPATTPRRTIDVSTLTGFLTLRAVERQARALDVIEADRRDAERREAERQEVERKAAEKREAERQEAERKAAERREVERRELEARAAAAATMPPPSIIDEGPAPAIPPPQRASQPRAVPVLPRPAPSTSSVERAPSLPPPMNIGPPPGGAKRVERPATSPAPRSAFDTLFGIQR